MSTPDKNNSVSNAATNSARSTTGTKGSVNVQSIINSIRTIAKTKELEQKVEKLIQAQKATALPGLNPERVVAQQAALSAGSAGANSGSPRDEDNNPGSVTNNAGKTAADAVSQASGGFFNAGTKQTTDKSTDKSDLSSGSSGNTQTSAPEGIYRIGDLFTDQAPYPSEIGDPNAPRIKEILGGIGGKNVSALLRELTPFDNVPVGWEDADTPGLEPGWDLWIQGVYWDVSSSVPGSPSPFPIPAQGFDAYLDYYNSPEVQAITGQRVEFINSVIVGPGDPPAFYQRDVEIFNISTGNSVGTTTMSVLSGSCSAGSSDYCPLSPSIATEFPLGEVLGFGWQNGKWNFHIYDSEGAQLLKEGKSTLLMDDDGNGYELGPKKGGGWYAAPTYVMPGTTPAVLIRPNGTVQGYIDKNLLPYYTGANTQTQNDSGFIGIPHLI